MRSVVIAAVALSLSACASWKPYEADWTLIGISDGEEIVLREELTRYRCRQLGREHIKRVLSSGWTKYDQVVCR